MSTYTKSGFKAYYDNTSGPFASSGAATVSGATFRQFAQDIADSVLYTDSFYNTDINYFEADDWIFNTVSGNLKGWVNTTSGAGASGANGTYGLNTTERAFGILRLETGTTAVGLSSMQKSGQLLFGIGHTLRLRQRVAVENLGTVAENYTIYFGFGDNAAAGDNSNGAYFRYNYNVNSGQVEAVTANGGVRTAKNTGITMDTAYHIYEIQVNSTGTSVAFYIDGVLVATNTTNIPTVNYTGLNFKIEKSAGLTTRYLHEDWYDLTVTVASAR